MKFLILGTPKVCPPPIEDREAALKAANAAVKKWLADGTLDCAYQCVPGGTVSIGNADSAEDLAQKIWSYPLYSQFDYHVTPLIDALKSFELLI